MLWLPSQQCPCTCSFHHYIHFPFSQNALLNSHNNLCMLSIKYNLMSNLETMDPNRMVSRIINILDEYTQNSFGKNKKIGTLV